MDTKSWAAFRGFMQTVKAFSNSPYKLRQSRDGRFSVYDKSTGKLVKRAYEPALRKFAQSLGYL